MAILVPALVLYGWAFWLLGNLLDVAYRVLYRLAQPLQWLRGKAASLVYGPSPRRLATILGGRQILMLTSRNDEADLLLQVGSAPARLYREYVATEFSRLGRLLEFVFLRPFVLGVFLKAFEMLLEVISLGVSVWRTLVLDFEVAPPDEQPYYPGHLLVRQRIDIQPGVTSSIRRPAAEAAGDDSLKGASTRPEGLRLSLREVTDEIKRQIQLRHSAYYDNEAVTRRVAEFLAGGEVEVAREPEPAPSLKPPDWYWEALLVGNIGLAVAFASTAGGRLPSPVLPYMVALNAYAIPLAFVGVNLLFHRAVRRRMPARPWRWSWVAWAVWVLMTLLVALGLRHGT